jgi:hypothetical protein
LLEVFLKRFGVLAGDDQLEAPLLLQMSLQRLQDRGLGFLAKSGQRPDATVVRSTRQLLHGLYIKLVIKGPERGREAIEAIGVIP